MRLIKYHITSFALTSLFFLPPWKSATAQQKCEAGKVCVTPGTSYGTYYHLELTLTPENTLPPSGQDKYGADRKLEIQDDGMFEIFIRKDALPVPSTVKDTLIVRMPGLLADNPSKLDHSKLDLFNKIKEMLSKNKGTVRAVIELNPYYDSKKNLIENGTLFFRTAHGKYIDHTGPLYESEKKQ